MIILFCVAIWLTSGFIAAGFEYAFDCYFYSGFPREDRKTAWKNVIKGPIALFFVIRYELYEHGWRKWW